MVGPGRRIACGEGFPRARSGATRSGHAQRYAAEVSDLTALLLGQRDTLSKAPNGRPVPPSDAYAAQIVAEMQRGRNAAVRQVLVVLFANLADGAPLPAVMAFVRRLEAILTARAEPPRERPLRVLHTAETRAAYALDLAQLEVITREDDPEALARCVAAADAQVARTQELRDECERRLVVIRTGLRPTIRAGAMALVP